jgi:hypothetical protein
VLTQFHRHLKRRSIYTEAIGSEAGAFPDMTTTFRIAEAKR